MAPNASTVAPTISDLSEIDHHEEGKPDHVYYAPAECFSNAHPEPLPPGTELSDIIKTLPKEAFEKSYVKAAQTTMVTVIAMCFSMFLIHVLPWYMLPIAWAIAGTASTGMFVIGHDCAHRCFTKSSLLNDVLGTIMMSPLVYPYEPWRIKHDFHHKNTNKLDVDNAWQPIRAEWFDDQNPVMQTFMRLIKGPMWWFASVGHWIKEHFFLENFEAKDHTRVKISLAAVYAFMLIGWPTILYNFGIWGFIKFWLMPWLGYHFWMSTFTMIHHTLPHIPFEPVGIWDDARARLHYTVHCDYPRWVELLCHDINWHVPHHVSTMIPHYNLRLAHASLRKNWGKHLHECTFTWQLISEVTNKCHLYNEKVCYTPFDDREGKTLSEPVETLDKWCSRMYQQLNWLHVPLLTLTPILGLYGILTCPFNVKTYLWAFIYYYITGLGITAGYHRFYAHRSYDANLPMRLFLMLAGTGAFEGSIRWWSRDHRAHHRYTDTDKDPYSAKNGFFYSHLGWMLVKQDPTKIGKADISDLNADPMVRWQHRNYYWFAPFMAFVLPTLVAGFGWGDFKGGFLLAGIARLVLVHHATFFVNSLAHFWGTQPFADNHTPRDSVLTALLTMGEGYHNFHHEFPNDYRNAIKFYQYDPTKWLITFCSWFGLTYNLRQFPENEVIKGRIQMEQKRLDHIKARVRWAADPATLPTMTLAEVQAQSRSKENPEAKKALVILDGLVHDVTDFVPNHPGGKAILDVYLGKDITQAFNGGVYDHSNAAHNLLGTMRLARLVA
eukprot:tig00020553_g10659.t1